MKTYDKEHFLTKTKGFQRFRFMALKLLQAVKIKKYLKGVL